MASRQLARATLACLVLDRMDQVHGDRGPERSLTYGEIVDRASGTTRSVNRRCRNQMADDETNQCFTGNCHECDHCRVEDQIYEKWGLHLAAVGFGRGAAPRSGLPELLRGVARLVQRGLEVAELPGLVALASWVRVPVVRAAQVGWRL